MWDPIILDVECIVCNKSLQKINHDLRHATANMRKIPNSRRLRTPNWSLEEKQYLLELIKERKKVVITKSNNGPNHSEEKDVAWNEILSEMVAKFGTKFHGSSIKKVKTQWQNMKRIAREEIATNGQTLDKYSRQSLEVCNILEMVKDGMLKTESESLNETTLTTNVEIKAECIEDEITQPSCSGINTKSLSMGTENDNDKTNQFYSSPTSPSERNSDINDFESVGDTRTHVPKNCFTKTTEVMTETPFIGDGRHNNITREMQEYFKCTSLQRQLKIESLKEERQVIRAMREAAELNKIIAEQKLKHVLWMTKREMAMYSGEPGSGAGKGGGAGGSIREAGGAFGEMGAAREEEYFHKKQREQLRELKTQLDSEIDFHAQQIKHHQEAINRHKSKLTEIEKK